jgi:ubiquinone/menaquinone biosynthesis C-methylase UbiE
MTVKQGLRTVRKLMRPFVPALLFTLDSAAHVCFALNRFVGWSYLKLWPIFGIHWYDHTFDYLLAPACNRSAERGTLANRYIKPGDIVLDVACGDGSLSGNFYSRHALHVDALDYDERAISHAKRKYAKQNITFFVADASRINFPLKKYDVIACFALIEHLSHDEGGMLLQRLGEFMKPEGVLIGSTLFDEVGANRGVHLNKFSSVQELTTFVDPYFEEVAFWCSHRPGRIDCYFECRHPRVAEAPDLVSSKSGVCESFARPNRAN